MDYLTLCMNVNNFAVTQYSNFDFNSMVQFNGTPYAAGTTGIFSLGNAQTDNTADIDAYFEFWIGDSGTLNLKRIRALHFGLEANGNTTVEITDDDGTSKTYDITILKPETVGVAGYTQHGHRIFVERTHKGRYWKTKVSNVDGADFSIDRIDVTWNVLGSKQNGS
jgi:hypothetical protein